jgi:hypothetical protein
MWPEVLNSPLSEGRFPYNPMNVSTRGFVMPGRSVNENKALRQVPQPHVFVGPIQRPHSPTKQIGDAHPAKLHIVVPKPIVTRAKVFAGLAPLHPIPPSPPNEPEDLPTEEAEQRTELPLLHDGKGKRDPLEPIAPEWSDGPLEEAAPTPAPILKLGRRPIVKKPA